MNQLLWSSSSTKICNPAISLPDGCSLLQRVPGQSRYCRYRRFRSQNDHGRSDFHRNELLRSGAVAVGVGSPDASLAPTTLPLQLSLPQMLQKGFATDDNSSLEKQSTYSISILGSTSFNRNLKTIETNHPMKTKLLSLVILTALAAGALSTCPRAFTQTNVQPTPSFTPAQTTPTQQMQGMDSNSDSMKQMAEMCMRMMKSEK